MKNLRNTSIIKVTFLLVFQLGLNSASAQTQPSSEYKGVIGKTLAESKEYWPEPVKAPKGAPNVVWILLDDVGYGASSVFGGLVNTPTFDNLANNGLRFTNFHTTGVCAPTRAALLTGRNHHTAHMGLFPHKFMRAGFPGYDAKVPSSTGTVAEVLRENGYSTYAVGKWHLTPDEETTDLGPFDRWPLGKGFDHFYGFLGGATDQYKPDLVEDNKAVKPDGRHLNTQLADKTISYLQYQQKVAPSKPFFLYLTPGATHSPHQVDQEWIDKYKGKFDKGWDWYRETVFANQKKLGIIPKDAKLPARNERVKAWDKLSAEEKRINARFFESYAGFFEQTDYEIGRIVDYLKKSNQFDNTIILLVIGDNGASKEGSYNGSVNNEFGGNTATNEAEQIAELSKNFDKIGTKDAYTNYPAGWAQAANTPFKFWKADAHAEGGTRNPLIVSYPNGIKNNNGIRTQYGHVIDLLPTTVELTGVKIPEQINGYKQDEIQGISLAYSVNDALAASKHTQQYYEIFSNRSIYKDGWKAAANHSENKTADGNFTSDKWELYNLNEDWTETNNLAAKNPQKLEELKALFESEALKYNVYPLKDSRSLSNFKFVANPSGKTTSVLYPGAGQIYAPASPALNFSSYSVTAETEINGNGAEGVLLANGGRFGGISLYVKNNKLHLSYTDGIKKTHLISNKDIQSGKNELKYAYVAGTPGKDGALELFINGEKVAESAIKKSGPVLYVAYDEGLDVGKDSNTPVDDEQYKVPFSFTGKLQKVIIQGQ